jgi:hypothetical protein
VFRKQVPNDFLSLPHGVSLVYARDHDHVRHDLHFHLVLEYLKGKILSPVSCLNAGLMLLDRDILLQDDALDFLKFLQARHGHTHLLAEQDCFNLIASRVSSRPLSEDYLVLSNWEWNTTWNRKRATAIHYVGGERYKRFDYLRDGLRVVRLLRSQQGFYYG